MGATTGGACEDTALLLRIEDDVGRMELGAVPVGATGATDVAELGLTEEDAAGAELKELLLTTGATTEDARTMLELAELTTALVGATGLTTAEVLIELTAVVGAAELAMLLLEATTDDGRCTELTTLLLGTTTELELGTLALGTTEEDEALTELITLVGGAAAAADEVGTAFDVGTRVDDGTCALLTGRLWLVVGTATAVVDGVGRGVVATGGVGGTPKFPVPWSGFTAALLILKGSRKDGLIESAAGSTFALLIEALFLSSGRVPKSQSFRLGTLSAD